MTLVIQSHRTPLPASWYEVCTGSVRRFAALKGFGYRWLGDELFEAVPAALLEKIRAQPVVATDLARLVALEAALAEGADRVVWMDADVLIPAPERFDLGAAGAQFGREVWVQVDAKGALRVFRKIHNAVMTFRREDPVLPFYRFAATRILERFEPDAGGMVPQLIGPKLLTLLHNAIGFDVLESAGALSPMVVSDLLAGGGLALECFRKACSTDVLAVNLCGSSVRSGGLDDGQMNALVSLLSTQPELLSV